MPLLFWIDLSTILVSFVIAISLMIIVFGTAPWRRVNLAFTFFFLMDLGWIVSAFFLRITLWSGLLGYDAPLGANERFWFRLTALFIGLVILCLFMFSAAYTNKLSRRHFLGFGSGILAMAGLYAAGVRYGAFSDIRLNDIGLVTDQVETFGAISAAVVPIYIVWSVLIIWRSDTGNKKRVIEIGLTVLFAGIIAGGLFNVPFPVMSIANAVCLLLVGYAVIKLQLLNPIRELNDELKASVREKEVLLKEIHHRVKNNFSFISSLLRLQAEDIESPQEGKKALLLCSDRIRSMALVHEHLYESSQLSAVDMHSYVTRMVNHLLSIYTARADITAEVNIGDIALDVTQAVPCGLILNELISNSLLHAFPDRTEGKIIVSMSRPSDKDTLLVVRDNGIGMTETCSLDHPQSLGYQLINILTEQIGGKITVSAEKGMETRILFPP